MNEHRSELARYHGQILIRCEWCGRYRHGAEWHRRLEPVPEGWIVIDGATCPECRQAEADREEGQDEAAELGRLSAWMAAETSEERGVADGPPSLLVD